jgi:hypothetical protein
MKPERSDGSDLRWKGQRLRRINLEVRDGFSGKKASREKIDEKTLCGG